MCIVRLSLFILFALALVNPILPFFFRSKEAEGKVLQKETKLSCRKTGL